VAYVVAMMGFSQDKRLLCRANAFRHSSGLSPVGGRLHAAKTVEHRTELAGI
jgi:hypothetical protein